MEKQGNVVICYDRYSENWIDDIKDRMEKHLKRDDGYQLKVIPIEAERYSEAIEYENELLNENVVVTALLIGTRDCQEGKKFEEVLPYINKLVLHAKETNTRLVLMTSLSWGGQNARRIFNKNLIRYAHEEHIRVADVYEYWKKEKISAKKISIQSALAVRSAVDAIFPVLTRTKLLVLWQFNGRYAHCNYACPYCYVATSVNKGMHFNYDVETWEKAFEKHFKDKEIIFYFSYGEPMMAGNVFYDVLEMIGRHPTWEVRMTSNVSLSLKRLLETRVAQEGRLNINASFHPTQISINKFLEKCDEIREHGIEPSVIYVMYPEQIDDLEGYMLLFRERGYRVHIRAFRGLYKGKKYPQAYTYKQWRQTAKYMDIGNFKYQLHAVNGLGRMSMLGMSHILVDNLGKIEMCDSYVGDRHYGNIFDDEIYLDIKPYPFPGLVPLASVDDISDYTEIDYNELEGNNVNSFGMQGGVIKKEDGSIVYPYEELDLDNKMLINDLRKVPKPFKPAYKFWFNPKWFGMHFVYSYLIKKYGKYILAWLKGKWYLFKSGKLSCKNFWHS